MTTKSKFLDNLAAQVAAGASVKAAASVVNCSVSHAYTLSGKPEFKAKVAELRSEITSQAVGKLSAAASQAADVLSELLDDDDAKNRLAAAKTILSMLGPLSELSELRERLDALEASQ